MYQPDNPQQPIQPSQMGDLDSDDARMWQQHPQHLPQFLRQQTGSARMGEQQVTQQQMHQLLSHRMRQEDQQRQMHWQMDANAASPVGFRDQGVNQMQPGLGMQQIGGNPNAMRLQALAAADSGPAMMQNANSPLLNRQLGMLIQQQPPHGGSSSYVNALAAMQRLQMHSAQQAQQHRQHSDQLQAPQQSQFWPMGAQLGQMHSQVQQSDFFPFSTAQGGVDPGHQASRSMILANPMMSGAQRSMWQQSAMQQQQPQRPQLPSQQQSLNAATARGMIEEIIKRIETLSDQIIDLEKKRTALSQDCGAEMDPTMALQLKTYGEEIRKRKMLIRQMGLQIQKLQEGINVAMGRVSIQQALPQPSQSQILPPRFPPLAPEVFASAFANFCAKANVHPEPAQLKRDGRQINLHQLHVEVMNMGTSFRIGNNDDTWAVIGGKLGFVQFPASDAEPAKCSPSMAAHLHHVYKQYLAMFDSTYIHSIVRRKNDMRNQSLQSNGQNMPPQNDEERRIQLMNQAQGPLPGAPPPQGLGQHVQMPWPSAQSMGTSPLSPSQRPALSAKQKPGLSGSSGLVGLQGMDPTQLNEFMKYASVPAQELRARGIPEVAIKWIESHRPILQRHIQQQQEYRAGIGAGMNANAQRAPSNLPQSLFNAGAQLGPQMSNAITAGLNMAVEQPQVALQIPLQNRGAGPASQAQQPPQMENRMPIPPIQQRRRPTAQEEEQGAQVVEHIKRDAMSRLNNMRVYNVPEHQLFEFNTLLEQVYKCAQEMEPNLPRFACFWKPDAIRHVVTMIVATQHQKQLLASPHPRHTMEVNTLRTMLKHFQVALEQYNNITAALYPEPAQNRPQDQQTPSGPSVQPMDPSQLSPSTRPAMSAEQKPELSGASGLPVMDLARSTESMKCTLVPAQELSVRGSPEVVIKWIESHRPIFQRTIHDVPHRDSPSLALTSRTSLLYESSSEKNYGALAPSTPSSKRILMNTALKITAVLLLALFLGVALWLALPTLEECVAALF